MDETNVRERKSRDNSTQCTTHNVNHSYKEYTEKNKYMKSRNEAFDALVWYKQHINSNFNPLEWLGIH